MKHDSKTTPPSSCPERMHALLLAVSLSMSVFLLLAACTHTDVEEGNGLSAKSEADACFYLNVLSSEQPVARGLRMTADGTVETDSLPQTRATDPLTETKEKYIRELWVAQYDASGTRLCTRYIPAFSKEEQIDLKLVVTTSDCHVYFVVNAGNLDAGSATEADFLDLSFAYRLTAEGLPADDNFVMKGEWTGTVDKGGIVGNIDLVRLLAKISLTYSTGGTDFSFTPTALRLCNVPSHSRYMEPEGQIAGISYSTYTSTLPPVAGDGTHTVYWYLPENRAGQATGDDAVGSVKQKTGKGVADATYIELFGTAVQSDVTYEDVSIRIYPGKDMNDYTVGRNCYYRQDIVLTGIDVTDERVTVGIVPGVTVEPGNMPAKKGGEKQVQVTARPGVEWFFELPGWLSAVIKGDTATYGNRVTYWGPEKVTFLAATANPHAEPRSLDFIVAGETITITQNGAVLNVSGGVTLPAVASAAPSTFTATPGLSWAVAKDAAWLTLTSTSAGSNNSTGSAQPVTYTSTLNPTGAVRTATITVKAGNAVTGTDNGLTKTIQVQQSPSVFSVSPTTVNFENTASSRVITVTATAGLTWSVSRSGDGNMTPASVSSSGTNTFTVSAPANTGAARTSYFTVTETGGGGRSAVVTATQKTGIVKSNIVGGLEVMAMGVGLYPGQECIAGQEWGINKCSEFGEDWRLPDIQDLWIIFPLNDYLLPDYAFWAGDYWTRNNDGNTDYDRKKWVYMTFPTTPDYYFTNNRSEQRRIRCVRNVK